jgi:hypothetical protein
LIRHQIPLAAVVANDTLIGAFGKTDLVARIVPGMDRRVPAEGNEASSYGLRAFAS